MNKRKPFKTFKTLRTLCVAGTLLLGFITAAPLRAYERQELVEPAALVIRVSHITDFLKAVEQSKLGQLWNSNEMKPFINNQSLGEALKTTFLYSIYEEKANRKELSYLLWEQMKLLKGETVVGITPPPPGGQMKFFYAAAMSQEDFRKNIELDERMAELDEDVSAPQKQTFQGVDLYFIRHNYGSGSSMDSWQAWYGETVLNGSDREWLERCIVRLKNELPASPAVPPQLNLIISKEFISSLLKPDEDMEIAEEEEETTLDNLAPQTDEPPRQPPVDMSLILNALGLNSLKALSLDFILNPQTMDFLFTIQSTGTGDKNGMWALFSKEHIPLNHRLAYVPSDIYSYQVLRLDIQAFWKGIPEFIKAINPGYEKQFIASMEVFRQMYQVDLTQDVFGNIGTLITTFSRLENLEKQELLAVQLRNPDVIEKVLTKFLGEGSFLGAQLKDTLEIHDMQGCKLYSFKSAAPGPGETPPADSGTPQTAVTYHGLSVIDGALVFGADKLVRGLIQAATGPKNPDLKTFYQTPAYPALMRRVPDDATAYAITDTAQLIRPFLEIFKNPMFLQAFKIRMDNEKNKSNPFAEFFTNLQFDRLPPVDFISSFFGKGISYSRYDGNTFTSQGTIYYQEIK